jgi:hypothetical protein
VPKLWVKGDDKPEGKFLVVRRDGTVPRGPHREDDPWVVEAMRQPGCRVFIGAIAALKTKE